MDFSLVPGGLKEYDGGLSFFHAEYDAAKSVSYFIKCILVIWELCVVLNLSEEGCQHYRLYSRES